MRPQDDPHAKVVLEDGREIETDSRQFGHRYLPSGGTWLGSLSYDDLQKLREVVKKVHMRNWPETHITDREADRIIDAMGPDTMAKLAEVHHAKMEKRQISVSVAAALKS